MAILWKMTDTRPIGVFDSGLGGLTVVAALRATLPDERLVYLGDTARVPYGTRSASTVVRYARACAKHLTKHGIKALVVACNTVSAVALEALRVELDIPVIGVIEPGARAGVAACGSGRLGVLATAGTVRSGAYPRAVAALSTRVEVVALPAPLLVPLVEAGWLDDSVTREVVRRLLRPLLAENVRALVLGCTHYPLIRPIVEDELRGLAANVAVVDGGEQTSLELATLLSDRELRAPHDRESGAGHLKVMVTDQPDDFRILADRFLGDHLEASQITQVDL